MTPKERGEIRSYYKGHVAYIPLRFLIYTAAGENPLEAQRMENEIERDWWEFHLQVQREKSKVEREQARRANRGN